MNFQELITRVKSHLRDERGTAFQEADIKRFINEGIDRIKQVINEFNSMKYLKEELDKPIFLPSEYHHLLSLYSASRCFAQDERHYQATNLMNEFEFKLHDMQNKIFNGELFILDEYGDVVDPNTKLEYVEVYFNKSNYDRDDEDRYGVF